MNPMGGAFKKMNKTSENMTYFIDNKTFLCQHKNLYPLTDRRVIWVSETMYRNIEKIVQHGSHKYITSEGGEDLKISN